MNFKTIMMMGLLIANVYGQDFVDVEIGEVHQPCQQVVETTESGQQTTDEDDVAQEEAILNDEEIQNGRAMQNGDGRSHLRRNIETYCVPFVNAIASGLIVGGILYAISH